MSVLLDILLGAERLAACAFSDAPEVRASVARNAPDLLVVDQGTRVSLEPQTEQAVTWLRKYLPNEIVIREGEVRIERHSWSGLCRAAINEGLRIA